MPSQKQGCKSIKFRVLTEMQRFVLRTHVAMFSFRKDHHHKVDQSVNKRFSVVVIVAQREITHFIPRFYSESVGREEHKEMGGM